MRPDTRALLSDAIRALERIAQFIAGQSQAEYVANAMLASAVERQFQIVGEAFGRLRSRDPSTAARIPGLDAAVGLRNVLVHGYAIVDDDIVFRTAMTDVPPLLSDLRELADPAE